MLPKGFCSYQIRQWKWFCEYIFYDFYHHVKIEIVHVRLDSRVSAFLFFKCQNLLQRDMDEQMPHNQ